MAGGHMQEKWALLVQVLKYQQLSVCTFLWYLWLFTWHQNELGLFLISSTASGGSWRQGSVMWKSPGKVQPDLACATLLP